MKKIFKTLVLCLLALTMTVSMFACNRGGDETTVDPVKKLSYDDGVHELNQTETGKYIVKDGVSDYKFVVNSSTYSIYTEAKNDFILLFQRATGVSLEIVSDTEATWSEDAKYISLGKTKLVDQAGISPDEYSLEKLGDEGVRILTKGNTVFLLGNTYGVSYSVYVLFEMMFNFEWYQRNTMYIDENVSNVPLMNYDVTDIPDVVYGCISERFDFNGNAQVNAIDSLYYGATAAQDIDFMGNRSRSANYSYYDLTCLAYPTPESSTGYNIHNILTAYLPSGVAGIEQKWYSDSGTQACFTAHGDAESMERFVDRCVSVIKDSVQRYPTELYPEKNSISITCSDGSTSSCMCETCTRIANANNGAFVASHIMFLNKVAEKVQAWMEENKDADFYRPDFQVYIFAYAGSNTPPTYYDEETGVATPCTEEVVCQKGAAIFYVGGNFWYPMYSEEQNVTHRQNLAGWKALTPNSNLWVWQNAGNQAATTFYDPLGSFNNDYFEIYAATDVELLYLSNDFTEDTGTAFMDLSYFVSKKLRWNCKLNMNDLVDEFMTAVYGDAADIMMNLYNNLKLHWYTIMDKLIDANSLHNNYIFTKELWPYQLNLMWYNECEKAIDAIKDVELVDPDLYKVMVHNIQKEEIAPLYNILQLHAKGTPREINDEQVAMYKSKLYDIVQHHPKMTSGMSSSLTILEFALL